MPIDGHGAALQAERLPQFGDRRDLAGLVVAGRLSQRQAVVAGPRRDQRQQPQPRPLPHPVSSAPGLFRTPGTNPVASPSNGQATQRIYWANKATAITADVPSEAELTPKLWGMWKVVAE